MWDEVLGCGSNFNATGGHPTARREFDRSVTGDLRRLPVACRHDIRHVLERFDCQQ
jgi:hypothetical protein